MLYNPPSGSSNPNAPFIGKNLGAGVQGSRVPPAMVEGTQREIVNAIVLSGQAPTNDDYAQLIKAIARGGVYLGPFSGSPNALVAALPGGLLIAALAGMRLTGRAPNANTGAVTVAITGFGQGLGAVPLVRRDGGPLQAGDLAANVDVDFRYDGTVFRLAGACRSEIRDNAVAAALPYTPAGASKKTAFTTFALTTIPGVFVDAVAQTLAVSGASYIDVTAATSVYYNAASGVTDRVGVLARVTLWQGATLVADGDYHIGSVLSPLETAPLVLRQVFQGLDPALTYTVKLIVEKSQAVDNLNVNDAYLIAYYG